MSFLVFIFMTIWISGLRSTKIEFTGDWTGRYPLDCFDFWSICGAKKPHYNLQNCSMSLFQCVVKHLCWEEKALPLTYLGIRTVLVTLSKWAAMPSLLLNNLYLIMYQSAQHSRAILLPH